MFTRVALCLLFTNAISGAFSLSAHTHSLRQSEVHVQRRQFGQPTVPLPADDSFYKSPSNLKSLKAGAIIRSRKVTLKGIDSSWGPAYESFQLLYRTQSHNGTAIASVTTLIRPVNATNDKLVSFQNVYDAVPRKCAPSFVFRTGSSGDNPIISLEFSASVKKMYAQNFIVAIPDYEGPDGVTSAGRLHGHVILDGARAALAFKSIKWNKARVAFYGYSGGAIAATWVAALHASYAPELPIAAITMGGVPSNPKSTITSIDGGLEAGLALTAVAGFAQAYKTVSVNVAKILTPAGVQAFDPVYNGCPQATVFANMYKRFQSTAIQTLGDKVLDQSWWTSVFTDNTAGLNKTETPTAPVFMFHGVYDESVPIAEPDALYSRWCKNGAKSIVYLRNNGNLNHFDTNAMGLPRAIKFINEAFAGKAQQQGCKTLNPTYTAYNQTADL